LYLEKKLNCKNEAFQTEYKVGQLYITSVQFSRAMIFCPHNL